MRDIKTFVKPYAELIPKVTLPAEDYNRIRAKFAEEKNHTRLLYRILLALRNEDVPVMDANVQLYFWSIRKQFFKDSGSERVYESFTYCPTVKGDWEAKSAAKKQELADFDAKCQELGVKKRPGVFWFKPSHSFYYDMFEDARDKLVELGFIETYEFACFFTTGRGRQHWNRGRRYGHREPVVLMRAIK